jgi:hypothetical protein
VPLLLVLLVLLLPLLLQGLCWGSLSGQCQR